MNLKRALTGGIVVAVVAAVMIGVNAESFWKPFLTALAFALLCVGAVAWLLVAASRRRTRN